MMGSEAPRIVRSSDRLFVQGSFIRLIVRSSDRSKDGCEARGGKDRSFVRSIVRSFVQGLKQRGDREAMVAFFRPNVRRMVAKQGAARIVHSSDRSSVRSFKD